MGEFQEIFPDARTAGCYFHLAQSVIRKVHEVGLKVEYETNEDVRIAVLCLVALSQVPVQDVTEAFELLSDLMPAINNIDEVLT